MYFFSLHNPKDRKTANLHMVCVIESELFVQPVGLILSGTEHTGTLLVDDLMACALLSYRVSSVLFYHACVHTVDLSGTYP